MLPPTKIGSYEAKTRLPELLRSVRSGKRYVITIRGIAVAELVPAKTSNEDDAIEAAAEMERFMKRQPPIRNIDIKALIEDGRP